MNAPFNDGLDIPAFLDLRNPEVAEKRERERKAQLAPVKNFPAAQLDPVKNLPAEQSADIAAENADIAAENAENPGDNLRKRYNLPKTMTAEAWEILREIEEPRAVKRKNSLELCKAKKDSELKVAQGGRWNSLKNRWVTPEEDFAIMAENARDWNGNPMTIEEVYAAFVEVSNLPDLPITSFDRGGKTITRDPNPESCRAFARRILAGLDQSKLAVEAERLARNARQRMKRKNNER